MNIVTFFFHLIFIQLIDQIQVNRSDSKTMEG